MYFNEGVWNRGINVQNFIMKNYTPYDGNEDFLAPPTERTKKLWDKVTCLMKKEHDAGGVLDIDTKTISDIDAYPAGYIDKELETIVGLQRCKYLYLLYIKSPCDAMHQLYIFPSMRLTNPAGKSLDSTANSLYTPPTV